MRCVESLVNNQIGWIEDLAESDLPDDTTLRVEVSRMAMKYTLSELFPLLARIRTSLEQLGCLVGVKVYDRYYGITLYLVDGTRTSIATVTLSYGAVDEFTEKGMTPVKHPELEGTYFMVIRNPYGAEEFFSFDLKEDVDAVAEYLMIFIVAELEDRG
jgi:hypothetical protein